MKAERIVVAAIVWFVAACQSGGDKAEDLPPPRGAEGSSPSIPKVATVDSEPGGAGGAALAARVRRYVGTTFPAERVEMAADSSGTIAHVYVDEGDRVERGQRLFRLKGQTTRLASKRAQQAITAANVQLEAARKELDRIRTLHRAGAATQAALDRAQAAFDAAESQADDAAVAASMSKAAVSDLTNYAPSSGTVTERFKDPGEAVTRMPPTVVLVIEDHDTLELRFNVPESEIRNFTPGTNLEAHVPALGVSKEVVVERTGSRVDPRTRMIEIIAELPNSEHEIKPGMSVNVSLADELQASARVAHEAR